MRQELCLAKSNDGGKVVMKDDFRYFLKLKLYYLLHEFALLPSIIYVFLLQFSGSPNCLFRLVRHQPIVLIQQKNPKHFASDFLY
jgi:hypothetical protein